jgi:heterodisulfide reductase subunit C
MEACSGNAPKRFRLASVTLSEEAFAFPINETANKKREALGLEPIDKDENAINELITIMKRTGYRG